MLIYKLTFKSIKFTLRKTFLFLYDFSKASVFTRLKYIIHVSTNLASITGKWCQQVYSPRKVTWWRSEHWAWNRSMDIGGWNGGRMDRTKPSMQKPLNCGWCGHLWSLIRKWCTGCLEDTSVYRGSWMDATLLCSLHTVHQFPAGSLYWPQNKGEAFGIVSIQTLPRDLPPGQGQVMEWWLWGTGATPLHLRQF